MTSIILKTDCKDEAMAMLCATDKAIAVQELRNKVKYDLKSIDFGEQHEYIENLYSLICQIDAIGEAS